jgi:hypothetical protein
MEHQGRDNDRGEAESFHRAWLHPLSPLKGTRRAADPTRRVIGFHRLIYDENVDSDCSDFSVDILIILPGQSLEWRPCVAMVWLPGPGSNELPAPRARTQGFCPKTF